ncbi:MAG: hypothetical protein ABR924_20470 [Terracidiphilus sp.]|jgi:hypothetical protein
MTTPAATPLTPEQARIIAERKAALVAAVEDRLPEFVKACRDPEVPKIIIQHQDAFGADYQDDEYLLLGRAIKYAGIHGKELRIHGKNRETLDQV